MPENNEFQRYAAECLRLAEKAQLESEKLGWMRLAELWLRQIGATKKPD